MDGSNGGTVASRSRRARPEFKPCVDPRADRKLLIGRLEQIMNTSRENRSEEDAGFLKAFPALVNSLKSKNKTPEPKDSRDEEKQDSPEVVERVCEAVAGALKSAKCAVVYTGAGISTAANIPDYRGPDGIWTKLRDGRELGTHDLEGAQPTLSHMALKHLVDLGIVKHVVSQNCDGLHFRSGIPRSRLSEVHGNMYIEACSRCVPPKEYVRGFDVTEKTRRYFHRTGRRCYYCGSCLEDTIVHFGERGTRKWPLNWLGIDAVIHEVDVILCLGTSLKVLKSYEGLWGKDRSPKSRPKLYIVNLQWTPKDKQATAKVHAKCDDFLQRVFAKLNLEIPSYPPAYGDPLKPTTTPLHPWESVTSLKARNWFVNQGCDLVDSAGRIKPDAVNLYEEARANAENGEAEVRVKEEPGSLCVLGEDPNFASEPKRCPSGYFRFMPVFRFLPPGENPFKDVELKVPEANGNGSKCDDPEADGGAESGPKLAELPGPGWYGRGLKTKKPPAASRKAKKARKGRKEPVEKEDSSGKEEAVPEPDEVAVIEVPAEVEPEEIGIDDEAEYFHPECERDKRGRYGAFFFFSTVCGCGIRPIPSREQYDMDLTGPFRAVIFLVMCLGCGFSQDITELRLGAAESGILKEYVTIQPGQRVDVVIGAENLPASADFVVFQAHTQNLPLTVSLTEKVEARGSVSGNHVGLVVPLQNATQSPNGTSVGWVINEEVVPVRGLVVVVSYADTDPIPGGCNMEFSVPVSPFLKLQFTEELDRVQFQRAGYASGGGFLSLSCDLSRAVDELRYEVFYFDLPEKDMSEATFFSNLEVMVSVSDLRSRGFKAKEISLYEQPMALFNSFPGLGMIYGVVAYRASNYSQAAAYVPLVTYSCRPFLNGGEDCNAVDNWFSWILCALAIFCGVLLILRGHRYFQTQLFFMAFAGFSFAAYIIFRNFVVPDHSVLIIVTMALGLAGGTFWIALWRKSGLPFLVVLMPGLITGALIGSMLLYSPLVNLEIFRADLNYWVVFACCAMIVPVVIGVNPRLLSIVSSSVVGAFAIVSACDRYLGGTLVFSVMNVVRRAVVDDFDKAYIVWPIQLTDVLLLGAWILVATLGAAIQFYFEAGRPPFPPVGAGGWQSANDDGRPPFTERSSLLVAPGAPDREPLLFPDYQSSRPASANGGRVKRGASGGPRPARIQQSEDALFSRESSASFAAAASDDEPPPPYFPDARHPHRVPPATAPPALAPCVPGAV